ncbi:hypothetical protein M422DRAFT_250573 [Sphaerobolus stellatus SS14]|uniref:Methyltransferase n=1 Tax=Sphaerobolus stellatus (strain SS14) TaxID=990650 RepID=A0A0C9VT86_SPHS4|nr:hypothetical protein M422DRAFT_250573 [Sphaerobolus stellatus SS14]
MATADIIVPTINYSSYPADGTKPFSGSRVDPDGKTTNITSRPFEIQVENIRGKEDQYDLDTSGFKYIKHKSALTKFTDDEEIQRIYYPETIEVLKKYTGANRVIIFDHTIRRHRPGGEDSPGNRQPALRAHVDQTPEAATNRVRRHAPELAGELLKHRYQIINLWRPISHPAFESPLAVCDYRSIDWDKDLTRTTLRYPDRDGETFTVNYNPNQKWKYLRGMTPEEALLIKCSDSITDGSVARLTPHTAFVDPTTPKDAPLRESIELRTLVFYDDIPNEE